MVQDRFSEDFVQAIIAATNRARIETLQAGVPVFYLDPNSRLDVMEMPDGRRFEIRYVSGAPADRNYEVLRELHEAAA